MTVYGGTGADVVERCSADKPKVGEAINADVIGRTVLWGRCEGYIAGVVDTYEAFRTAPAKKVCLPPGVTMDQLRRVVKKSLEDNPAHLHQPAVALVVAALADGFPCK